MLQLYPGDNWAVILARSSLLVSSAGIFEYSPFSDDKQLRSIGEVASLEKLWSAPFDNAAEDNDAPLVRWKEFKKDAAAAFGTIDGIPPVLCWDKLEVIKGLDIWFTVRLYSPGSMDISELGMEEPWGLSRPVFSRFLHLALENKKRQTISTGPKSNPT